MESTGSRSLSDYKQEHVEFVSSENGTSVVEVASIFASISLLPLLASLMFPWIIPVKLTVRCGQDKLLNIFLRFLVEFPFIVILPCLIVTLFTSGDLNDSSVTIGVTVAISVACLLIFMVNHTMTRPTLTILSGQWDQLKDSHIGCDTRNYSSHTTTSTKTNIKIKAADNGEEEKTCGEDKNLKKTTQNYPFITNARGLINYITIICILAVDFQIFPRRFAKTKKYGVSLMDVGTATFIFANGIVSPEAKNCLPNFRKSIVSSIPLFILGFGRLLAIKGSEYHEVIEEYGVHWNFFFTLAAVKIMGTIIFTLFSTKSTLKLCIAVGIIYEAFLLLTNIQENYLLNPDITRHTSLVDANREGIFSTFGYLTIYLASVYCGQRLFTERKTNVEDWVIYWLELGWQGMIAWSLFYSWHNYGNPSCRRVANLSYVLWTVAMSYTLLFLTLFVSMTQTVTQKLGFLHGPVHRVNLVKESANSKEMDSSSSADKNDLARNKIGDEKTPVIENTSEPVFLPDLTKASLFCEAINFNGLVVFILGNLLTGIVNYSMITKNAGPILSAVILLGYATAICFTSFILYWFNIRLKFW